MSTRSLEPRDVRGAPEYFGAHASVYDSRYDGPGADGYALRRRMETVLRIVGSGPGTTLDVGMGPGRLCAALDELGWTVSGVDASDEMVAVTRARLPRASARLACARIESIPYPDESFDVVTAIGVLEYSDVPRGLSELARVLRPGGRAVVSYPNPRALYGIWKTRAWYPATRLAKRALRRPHPEMPHGAGELPPPRFAAELQQAGLVLLSSSPTSYLPLPTPLEKLLPRPTARFGDRLARRGGARSARLFATQIVYESSKRAEGAP